MKRLLYFVTSAFLLAGASPLFAQGVSGVPQSAAVLTAFASPVKYGIITGASFCGVVNFTFSAPSGGVTLSNNGTCSFDGGTTVTTWSANMTALSTLGAFPILLLENGASQGSLGNVTVTAGPATSLQLSASPATTQTVGTGTITLSASVADTHGNPVTGQLVTFSVPGSGASATFAGGGTSDSETTNSSGVATSLLLTADHTPGTFNATVASSGLTTQTLGMTNVAGAPASVVVADATTSAVVGTGNFGAITATVKDTFGNVLSGQPVVFSVPTLATAAGGTFGAGGSDPETTNGSGVATSTTLSSNTVAGTYNVTASVTGTAVTGHLAMTNTPGVFKLVQVYAGSNQSVATAKPFGTLMQALVTDIYGNPASGGTVVFTAPSSGSGGTFPPAATTATVGPSTSTGLVSAPVLTANSTVGPFTVTAALQGTTSTATFNLAVAAGTPASISVTSGTQQSETATVNSGFASPLSATVLDSNSNPVAFVNVTFTAPSAGAGVSFNGATTATVQTNASGVAVVPGPVTANATAGAYSVVASVPSVPSLTVSYSLSNSAGAPASISLTTGAGLSAQISSAFSAITATVKDSGGNVVPGASVNFSVATVTGGATATFAASPAMPVLTNSVGVANAPVLSAGTLVGTISLTASVASTPISATTPALSPLTITAGPAAAIAITAGNTQSAAFGAAFVTALSVKVTDTGGNPVANASVSFVASTVTGGANGNFATTPASSSATATTNNLGIATAPTMTAQTNIGTFSVAATVVGSGVNAAVFSESVTSGVPSTVALASGGVQGQSALEGAAFPISLQVLVTDAGGHPVGNVPVVFLAPASGASAVFGTQTNTTTVNTSNAGLASAAVTAGGIAGGPYSVTATAASVATPYTFTLTNLAGPAAKIVIQSGNNQSVAINGTFPSMSVLVEDSGNNPVANGTAVTFAISPCPGTGASGTFTGKGCSDSETTTAGLATTSVALVANSLPGAFTVTATSGSVSPAAFTLTNLAGTPSSMTIVAGDPQAVTINKPFAVALQVKVVDAGGNAVAGVPVTFTVPSSGATAVFAGSNVVLTDANGLGTSPVLTANGTGGTYLVTASTTFGSVTFHLTNLSSLTISGIAPDAASENSAADVPITITGSGFVATDVVQFTRNSAAKLLTNASVSSLTTLTATIPKAYLAIPLNGVPLTVPETDAIAVIHPDGTSATFPFTVNPPPGATAVSPTSVTVGTPNFVLTITGSNFDNNATVLITSASGASQSVTPSSFSANSLAVSLSPAVLTSFAPSVAGSSSSVSLTVAVLDNGTTSTLTGALNLLFPVVTTLSPTSVASGGVQFPLTVNGSNFLGTSVIHWCGSGTGCTPGASDTPLVTSLVTNSLSAPALQAVVPAALIAQSGSAVITVVNSPANPAQTLSNSVTFNFGGLQLNSISPTTVQSGSNGFTLSVTGLNFQPDAVVHWLAGGQDVSLATSTVLINGATSTTLLTATVPQSLIGTTGTAQISVANVANATRSNALAFNVVQSAITSLSQTSAPAGTPGLTLTINGNNFATGLTVQWTIGSSSTPITPSQTSPTQITVAIPASLLATAGAAQISVTNSGAISSNSIEFDVDNPAITPPLAPASVALNAATFQLTVTGNNFLSGSVVQWNDGAKVTPLSTTYTSATQLTALVTSSLLAQTETAVISVLNPGTGSPAPASNAVPFAVGPAPTISPVSSGGLSPATVAAGSASFVLTVTGTNFTSSSVVVWDPGLPGAPVKLTTYLSDPVNFTTLTANIPASLLLTQGSATITVQNAGPVSSNPVQFVTGAGVSPTIFNLTPNSGTAGISAPVQMIITGSSFESGATVQWNGAAGLQTLTPVFVSSGQLDVNVTATLLASAGTASVTVTNPGGGVSNSASFTINPPNQVAITSLQITSAPAGSGTLLDTINGQYFVAGSVVLWNNGAAATPIVTQYVNATTLTAVIPPADLAAPGLAFLSVQNPDKTVSNTELFTIGGALPTIASLSQTSTPAGTASLGLTVTGTGFTASGTTVLWGATPIPTLVNSATQLSVSLTSAQLTSAGIVSVTVETPGGTSNAIVFTVGGPAILVLAPSSATVGASGVTLNVGGQNFLSGSTVMWQTTALTTTFVSATQLSAVVPPALLAAAGADNITVQNPGGATSGPSPFTVGTGPAISTLAPLSVSAGSGALTLSIGGSNFAAGDQVLWNGAPLATTFGNSAVLTASVPANMIASAGTVNVEILHAGGVLSNLMQLTVAGPAVASVAPAIAAAGSASVQITVTGANFIQESTVQWNSAAIPTAFVNSTTLTAQVATALLQNPGTALITVSSGTAVSSLITFQVAAPSISSLSPGTGVAGLGALTLTVNGTNFVSGSVVSWNGSAVPTTFTSATQVVAVVPATLTNTAGANIVTVANPGGSASGLAVFSLTTPPAATVVSFSPLSAIAGSQAFVLTVTGTGFNATSTVVWNGNSLPTTYVSATQITAFVTGTLITLPVQANITVQNFGAAAAVPAVFSVAGPTITSLSPTSSSAGGPAFTLSVTGTNYLPGSLIQWNSVSLPTAYGSATSLTASVPASLITANGNVSVTVENPGGATSPASAFTIGPFTLALTTVSLPDAIVGQTYSAPALQASGGSAPYTWSITGGVIPQGLTLDPSSGTISGTATAPGIASLTITVTDSVGRTVSKTLTIHAVLPLTISNTTPLPAATLSSAYSLLLAASGGTPPYTWSAGGSLPTGLLLNATTGQISGTPQTPGLSQFTITATDSRSLTVTSPLSLTTTLQSVTIGGVSAALSPAQQPAISLQLGGPYNTDLSGRLTLSFGSSVGADDQSIQFSTGGRTASFTLPAGSSQPLFGQNSTINYSTGTTAGNLTIQATVDAGSANVTPTPAPSQTGAIAKLVPAITSTSLTTVSGGLNVSITGYSTTREIVSATLTFNPAAGATVKSAPITVQLATAFAGWYSSAASTAAGSAFTITLPFSVTGNVAAIGSVTVTLTNSQGASAAATASR